MNATKLNIEEETVRKSQITIDSQAYDARTMVHPTDLDLQARRSQLS